eukprot:2586528-Rhodomonas_salina.1
MEYGLPGRPYDLLQLPRKGQYRVQELAQGALPPYAMSSTDRAYCPTRCPVLIERMLYYLPTRLLRDVRFARMMRTAQRLVPPPYAMSGTDVG